jgi:hypothetical protein
VGLEDLEQRLGGRIDGLSVESARKSDRLWRLTAKVSESMIPTLRSEHPYESKWPASLMSKTVTGLPASTLVLVTFHPCPSSSPTSNVETNALRGPPFFFGIGAFSAAYRM